MKKYLFTLLASLIGLSSYSQNEIEDGKSLIEAYVSPLTNSLGSALNNGWYNTAKPHKLGGFDITLTTNFVFIPEEAKTFNISEEGGESFEGDNTPTILGEGDGSLVMNQIEDNYMPSGLNVPIVPLPILQAGIGLIKGTEVNFRYIPDIEIVKDGKVGLFGIGIKHDILQWFPIVNNIPIDLSVQAGHTKIGAEIILSEPNLKTKDKAHLDISSTTVNLLLSKKLLIFTPYCGLGYSTVKTSFSMDGKYNIGGTIDEIDTEMEFNSKNNFRANIGFRLSVAIIKIQANYTFSKYPIATLGVGVSLR